jgi:hypothetical protein
VGDGSLVFTEKGEACAFPTPRALELGDIPGVVQQFADAARNAIAAGFHGVEVRAYLVSFVFASPNTATSVDYMLLERANSVINIVQQALSVQGCVGCPARLRVVNLPMITAAVVLVPHHAGARCQRFHHRPVLEGQHQPAHRRIRGQHTEQSQVRTFRQSAVVGSVPLVLPHCVSQFLLWL